MGSGRVVDGLIRAATGWMFLALVVTAVAQDGSADGDDEEESDVDFLIIEQPRVDSGGGGGYARLNIGLHKKEAMPATVQVRSPNGYAATWEGRPGTRASFGLHEQGEITVLVDDEELSVRVPKLKGRDRKAGVGQVCWLTVRSKANKRILKGKCVSEPPPIALSEASCNAPITPPTAGLALLENVSHMLGCVAWRFQRASNLSMRAQADMASALGLKAESDAARRRLDNLRGVEDPIESQSMRAQQLADTALIEAIASAAAQDEAISEEAMVAIDRANQMRIAANKVAEPIPAKIAEMTAYITVTVATYVANLTAEGVDAASNPLTAASFAIRFGKMMAELRPKYLRNVIVPLGKMVKQSGDLYRAADTKLEQALETVYASHSQEPPDPQSVDVQTFESDAM